MVVFQKFSSQQGFFPEASPLFPQNYLEHNGVIVWPLVPQKAVGLEQRTGVDTQREPETLHEMFLGLGASTLPLSHDDHRRHSPAESTHGLLADPRENNGARLAQSRHGDWVVGHPIGYHLRTSQEIGAKEYPSKRQERQPRGHMDPIPHSRM